MISAILLATLVALTSACYGGHDDYKKSLAFLQTMIQDTEDARMSVRGHQDRAHRVESGTAIERDDYNIGVLETLIGDTERAMEQRGGVSTSSGTRKNNTGSVKPKKKSSSKRNRSEERNSSSSDDRECIVVPEKKAASLFPRLPTRNQVILYGAPIAVTAIATGFVVCLNVAASSNPLCSISNLAACLT